MPQPPRSDVEAQAAFAKSSGGEFAWYSCVFLVCFVVFGLLPILFAFVYHLYSTIVLLIVAEIFLASLIPLLRPQGSLLAAWLGTNVLTFTVVGLHIYYADSLPLLALDDGRSYTNVYTQEPAEALADAAMIHFAGSATVDDTKALGMTSLEAGAHTYCVAPVSDLHSTGRVSVWAVGLNCCGRAGSFTCGDADVSGVNGGYVLSSLASVSDPLYSLGAKYLVPPDLRHDIFLKAVARAQAVHGLGGGANPLVVVWSALSRQELRDDLRSKLGLHLFAGLVGAALAATVATFIVLKTWIPDPKLAQVTNRNLRLPLNTPSEVTAFLAADFSASTSRSSRDLFLLGFLAPLFTSVVSVSFWTWARCLKYGDLWSTVFMGVIVAMGMTLLLTPRKRVFGLLLILCGVTAAVVGEANFVWNTSHYCNVVNRRSYTDVPTEANSMEYADAGKLHFEASAKFDSARSVGFLYQGKTYCAAPILRESARVNNGGSNLSRNTTDGVPQVARADFWAVGMDCCNARGSFGCVGGSDGTTGLVLRDNGDETYEAYLRAVRGAAEMHSLPRSEAPMLVLWHGDVEQLHQLWLGRAVGVCVGCAAAFLLVLGFISCVCIRKNQARLAERKRAALTRREEADAARPK